MSISFVGRVIGTKMRKTAKVEVFRLKLDPIVLKVCQIMRTKFLALMTPDIIGSCDIRRLN